MAQLRPKIVKLAKIIGGVTGITTRIDENAPEYYCMAGILTDEEADVAIAAGLRKERTAAYLARKVGKTVQEVQPLLDNLVYYGIFRRSHNETLGEDTYYMQIFAPGILEMMVNQKELLDTHPEVGRAFEEYTRNLAANMGAMIPDGYGLMRVIPVESALEGIPGVNEFERISHYLDKYDRFSVSPCSCRASRTSIGDGCGHLDEDMCIQMGKGAEHYIRSGRAKEITREQALEIIKRAEENGLMHDMVNIEEPGESAAICNCCACACFGLRVGLMYGARDAIRSNYVAEVDEAKCVACGQCVETCPGNALKLGQKLCSTEDLTQKPDYVKLSETLHPKRTWDPNYREDHEDVVPTGTAPCKTACPAHIPVQGYLKLAAQGRYTDALELIKKENPFPAVCGRICNKRCEAECTRGDVDEAVAIDEVKRFIADHDLHEATRYVPKLLNQIGRPYTEKIAVIGAGPAGMSCAYYLANKGYPVTVFDRNPVPGGMLTLGIPSFRLEKDVLNAEIDILREMGVEFQCGVEVGKDITIEQLRAQGYKGFYVAIGAQKSAKLRIPGEELEGVYGGVDFLRAVNLGHETHIGKRCAVIGGGNVAMGACRRRQRGHGRLPQRGAPRRRRDVRALPPQRSRAARRPRGGQRGDGRGRAVPLPDRPGRDPRHGRQGHGHPCGAHGARRAGREGPPQARRHGRIRDARGRFRHRRHRPDGRLGHARRRRAHDDEEGHGRGRRADLSDRAAGHFRRRRLLHRPEVCHRRHCRRQGGRHQPAPLCAPRPDAHRRPRPQSLQGARQGARAHRDGRFR